MSLKRNIIANYFGQGWSSLIGIVFIPVYIKYLGIESYGLIGVFGMLQTWLSLLDMGMTPTLGREMARFTGGVHTPESIRDLLRTVEIIACLMAFLTGIGIFFSSDFVVNHWLKIEKNDLSVARRALNIMGIIIALRFIENIYRSALIGLQRQVTYNIINCSIQTIRAVGAIGVLALVSNTIDAFFIWQGIISLITILIFFNVTYRSIPKGNRNPKFSKESIKEIWHYAGGITLITILALMLTQVDKLLLSKLLNLKEYGYYTLAVTVAGGIYALIHPIGQAFQPKLCESYAANDIAKLTDTYHKGAQFVTVVVGSGAIMLIIFAKPILFLWTQNYELTTKTYRLLQLIALGNFLNSLCWMPHLTQLAYGWTSLSVKVNIVAVCFIVPAILWATPRFGAEGAAAAWVALNAGYVLISIHLTFRRILSPADKWRWYLKDILLPILPAIIISVISKVFFPASSGKLCQLIYIGITTAMALASITFSAPHLRFFIFNFLDIRLRRKLFV